MGIQLDFLIKLVVIHGALGLGDALELGAGVTNLGQGLQDGLLGLAQGVVHVAEAGDLDLLHLLLGLADALLALSHVRI